MSDLPDVDRNEMTEHSVLLVNEPDRIYTLLRVTEDEQQALLDLRSEYGIIHDARVRGPDEVSDWLNKLIARREIPMLDFTMTI